MHANQRNIRPQILTNLMLICLWRCTFDLKLICLWLTMRGLQHTRVCVSDLLDLCVMKSFSMGHNSSGCCHLMHAQRTPHRTHACADFLTAHSHVITRGAQCMMSLSSLVMSCLCSSFLRLRFLYLLYICDFTDDTYCLTCAINWKQTTTLRYFAGEGTLWPIG